MEGAGILLLADGDEEGGLEEVEGAGRDSLADEGGGGRETITRRQQSQSKAPGQEAW